MGKERDPYTDKLMDAIKQATTKEKQPQQRPQSPQQPGLQQDDTLPDDLADQQ